MPEVNETLTTSSTYFSQRLKAVRDSLGLSISTISKRSGLGRNTLYRYEAGVSAPATLDVWTLLAQAHAMSLEEYMDALFGKKNNQPIDEIKRLENAVERLEELVKLYSSSTKDSMSDS